MHKETRTNMNEISSPRVLFTQTHKLKPTKLSTKEVKPSDPPDDNVATLPLSNQPPLPYSSHIDIPEDLDMSPVYIYVDASSAACLASEGDLPGVHLKEADKALLGLYQEWVHQNLGIYLDGGIDEDGKCQAV